MEVMSKSQVFINKYYASALQAERVTGIPAIAMLTQSALESGWGEKVANNNMFGIKADKNWKGSKVLITTSEVHSSSNVKYPVVISVTKRGDGKFLYRVKDYFRSYPTPADSFIDYANFIKQNKRYKEAVSVANNPVLFLQKIAAAGYATDPSYASKLIEVMDSVKKRIEVFVKSHKGSAAGLGIVAAVMVFFYSLMTEYVVQNF